MHVCIHVCEAHVYVHVRVGGWVHVFACTMCFPAFLACKQTYFPSNMLMSLQNSKIEDRSSTHLIKVRPMCITWLGAR